MTPLWCIPAVNHPGQQWNVSAKDHTSPFPEAAELHPSPAAAPPLHHTAHCAQEICDPGWIPAARPAQRRQVTMGEDQVWLQEGPGGNKEAFHTAENWVFWPLGRSRGQTVGWAHAGAEQSLMGVQRSREPGAVDGVLRSWDRRPKWSLFKAW